MNKAAFIQKILQDKTSKAGDTMVSAYAPSNIALCKYWGKRDDELSLPQTSSLSISLGDHGTTTVIQPSEKSIDEIYLNEKPMDLSTVFSKRIIDFIDLFRENKQDHLVIKTQNNIPLAAGLASSASGFAALTQALNLFYDWQLDQKNLSFLARLGSGSACRSLWHGFVLWHRGEQADGLDSFAQSLDVVWPDLCVGLLITNRDEKPISSRQAMRLTRETSALYQAWPEKVARDLVKIKEGVAHKNLELLGRAAESNALAMHGLMMSSEPPVLYWLPETVANMRRVWQLRADGVPVYFTQDAGANLKLLFEKKDLSTIERVFPMVDIIEPFSEFIHHE
jgi:diphosphomevalonate decarboxylase